ncbi:MAG: lipoprotein [Xanthomonadaceae bacterium]|nr:lipoprotein [Xanthomonadaceae bacterium]
MHAILPAPRRPLVPMLAILFVLGPFALGGCGLKGDLYLPEQGPPSAQPTDDSEDVPQQDKPEDDPSDGR